MERVKLTLEWSAPIAFSSVRAFPRSAGVYCILLAIEDSYRMVRIGAAHNLRRRPANYEPTPFQLEPQLRLVYCLVPPAFSNAMKLLLGDTNPALVKDCAWLEYRMERLLLDEYTRRWTAAPPGNFAPGSSRAYLSQIDVTEVEPLRVLDLPPATVTQALRESLVQSKRASRVTRPEEPLPEDGEAVKVLPTVASSARFSRVKVRSREQFLDALEASSAPPERCDAHIELLDLLTRAEGLEPRFDSGGDVHTLYKVYLSDTEQHIARVYANGRVMICLHAFDEQHLDRPELKEPLHTALGDDSFVGDNDHSPSLRLPIEELDIRQLVRALQTAAVASDPPSPALGA